LRACQTFLKEALIIDSVTGKIPRLNVTAIPDVNDGNGKLHERKEHNRHNRDGSVVLPRAVSHLAPNSGSTVATGGTVEQTFIMMVVCGSC
jgi:hypothetical protein